MTDVAVPETKALAVWASRNDVRELDTRLREMLPGADKLNTGQRLALAQASLAHGLDPFNGEIWMIPGRGLMIGVKGLRKKAHQQVKGNYWTEFVELTDPEARKRLRIPDGALAFECRLFDSENLRTYAETVKSLMDAHIPWEAVCQMVGSKPYTLGIGVLKAGEQTKMEPAQCAMKRAEADAIKRRFDVPFGLTVEADVEPDAPGEWVDGSAAIVSEPNREPVTDAEKAEKHAQDKAAMYGEDDPTTFKSATGRAPTEKFGEMVTRADQAKNEAIISADAAKRNEKVDPKSVTLAKMGKLTAANTKAWQDGCRQIAAKFPKYAKDGQPNYHHILGAACKCNFSEVNDGNFELVIEAVGKRAAELASK